MFLYSVYCAYDLKFLASLSLAVQVLHIFVTNKLLLITSNTQYPTVAETPDHKQSIICSFVNIQRDNIGRKGSSLTVYLLYHLTLCQVAKNLFVLY